MYCVVSHSSVLLRAIIRICNFERYGYIVHHVSCMRPPKLEVGSRVRSSGDGLTAVDGYTIVLWQVNTAATGSLQYVIQRAVACAVSSS